MTSSPRRTVSPKTAFARQLHPLDEFRAMQAMVEKDTGIEEIAAHFHTTPAAVRQRLRLAGCLAEAAYRSMPMMR
jgi:alpha-D-ribose 1-methylphosphonate 5-phosphate C-P lyase